MNEEKTPAEPHSPEKVESLSGDEGHDRPAPPRTNKDAMPKQPDSTEPVVDVEVDEVALAGDGQQPPVLVEVPDPKKLEDTSAITPKGPTVADLADDDSALPDSKAGQLETEKAVMSMAIVVAIVVALVLIGLSYAAFVGSDDKEQGTISSEQEQEAQPNQETAPIEQSDDNQSTLESLTTSQSLQSEFDAIQQEIESLDDETDFPEAQLSDQSLELL